VRTALIIAYAVCTESETGKLEVDPCLQNSQPEIAQIATNISTPSMRMSAGRNPAFVDVTRMNLWDGRWSM